MPGHKSARQMDTRMLLCHLTVLPECFFECCNKCQPLRSRYLPCVCQTVTPTPTPTLAPTAVPAIPDVPPRVYPSKLQVTLDASIENVDPDAVKRDLCAQHLPAEAPCEALAIDLLQGSTIVVCIVDRQKRLRYRMTDCVLVTGCFAYTERLVRRQACIQPAHTQRLSRSSACWDANSRSHRR